MHDDGPWAGRHLDAESKRVRPASRNPNAVSRGWRLAAKASYGVSRGWRLEAAVELLHRRLRRQLAPEAGDRVRTRVRARG